MVEQGDKNAESIRGRSKEVVAYNWNTTLEPEFESLAFSPRFRRGDSYPALKRITLSNTVRKVKRVVTSFVTTLWVLLGTFRGKQTLGVRDGSETGLSYDHRRLKNLNFVGEVEKYLLTVSNGHRDRHSNELRLEYMATRCAQSYRAKIPLLSVCKGHTQATCGNETKAQNGCSTML